MANALIVGTITFGKVEISCQTSSKVKYDKSQIR